MKFPHLVNLVLGDPSDDGHGKTDSCFLSSNLDRGQMWEVYRRGVTILGFDVCNEIATDYEDHAISSDQISKLAVVGYEISPTETTIWKDEFKEIFLLTVKLGYPEFEYEICTIPDMDIGGYGFFT